MNLRIDLYDRGYVMSSVTEMIITDITVWNRRSQLSMKYGPLQRGEAKFDHTFVFEADVAGPQIAHSRALSANSAGAGIIRDYALAATDAVQKFCDERGWTIDKQLSHWPVLQFVVSNQMAEPFISFQEDNQESVKIS